MSRKIPVPGDAETERVAVELGDRRYEVIIGDRLIASAGDYLTPLLRRPYTVVVSDDNVNRLYGPRLSASLEESGIKHRNIVVPAGEGSKSFSRLEEVLERLIDARIERGDTIVALGGGVIGDLAGLAAGLLRRGVGIVHIPTSLLAQVDSSVGGKTAINSRSGKNLVGMFHQPKLVLADIGALDSLPDRQLRAGYGEIVKYAVLGDEPSFDWLEQHGHDILNGSRPARRQVVAACCRAKAAIVGADERETGARALLNLGHTFAHALEAEAGLGDTLLHGEAVSIGLVLALDLSVRLGFCAASDAKRVRRHLSSAGLPVSPQASGGAASPARLIEHMKQDKKIQRGDIPFILCRGIGKAFVARDIDLEDVRAVLDHALKQTGRLN